jgi:hypothetical protein
MQSPYAWRPWRTSRASDASNTPPRPSASPHVSVSDERVRELRREVVARGVQTRSYLSDAPILARVLAHVGDVDLAATAIELSPRPPWLRSMIGTALAPPRRR